MVVHISLYHFAAYCEAYVHAIFLIDEGQP
jgi:hypothetical protein